MKPSEVTMKVYLVVADEQVPISFTIITEANGYKELLKEVTAICVALKEAGFKLLPLDIPQPTVSAPVRSPQGRPGPGFTWPAPMCPDCKREMKVSKFQKDETKTNYHCTAKLPTGAYCTQCAAVDNKSGSVNYWEATK